MLAVLRGVVEAGEQGGPLGQNPAKRVRRIGQGRTAAGVSPCDPPAVAAAGWVWRAMSAFAGAAAA